MKTAAESEVAQLVTELGGDPAKGGIKELERIAFDYAAKAGFTEIERLSDMSDSVIVEVCAATGGNAANAIAARGPFLQAEEAFATSLLGA